jgi:hypothetical protein
MKILCRVFQTACVGLLACAAASCRAESVWAGVEFEEDTGAIKVSSEEPLCACFSVENISGREIALESTFHQTELGKHPLKPGEQTTVKFDWAGHDSEDIYRIYALEADGSRVPASSVLKLGKRSRWQECGETACSFGDLKLSVGLNSE